MLQAVPPATSSGPKVSLAFVLVPIVATGTDKSKVSIPQTKKKSNEILRGKSSLFSKIFSVFSKQKKFCTFVNFIRLEFQSLFLNKQALGGVVIISRKIIGLDQIDSDWIDFETNKIVSFEKIERNYKLYLPIINYLGTIS